MLTNKVVKKKKLQRSGNSTTMALLPKMWINELGWSQETPLIFEFLPHRKQIIITEDEKVSESKPTEYRDSLESS